MKKSIVLVCLAMLFSLFASAQNPTITVQNVAAKYAPGFPANVTAMINSNGSNVEQLCMVKYEIKRNGELVENVADFGTVTYSVRLQGEETITKQITEGSGFVSGTVTYDEHEYNIEAFSLGIFDNNECANRNRPIEVVATFNELGSYSVKFELVSATTAHAEEVQTIHTYTDCQSVEHNDLIALNPIAGATLCEYTQTVNVVPSYTVTFEGLEGNEVTVDAPARRDAVMQGDDYVFSIALTGNQTGIASVTVGNEALVANAGKYKVENVQENITISVAFTHSGPVPTMTVSNVNEKYAPGFPADVTVRLNSNGSDVEQLCMVKYEIKRNGVLVENVADFGTVSYTVRLQGDETMTRQITEGSGFISGTVTYDEHEYNIDAFSLGIFDNNECAYRNRPIEVVTTFDSIGNYTVGFAVVSATTEHAEEIQTVHTYTDCQNVQHNDLIAVNPIAGDTLCAYTAAVNVVPSYRITFVGLEEGNEVTAFEPARRDSIMQGDDYVFSIALAECQASIVVTAGNEVLVANDGKYTLANVVSDTTISVSITNETYTITAEAGEHGSVAVAEAEVQCGDNYVVRFIPESGYQIATVTLDGVETTEGLNGNNFTITNVRADHEVAATFEEVVFAGPYFEFIGVESSYEVGDTIEVTAKLHSNGNIDNLCGVGYKVIFWDTDSTNSVVTDLTRNGVFSYDVRLADEAIYHNQVTEGEGMVNVEVEYDETMYNIGAFTMGIFDNDCVNRNRPINFNMIFTQAGRYQVETTIYTCSNGGDEIGTSYVAVNCDGLTHYDRVAETCSHPTPVSVQMVDVLVEGTTIYTITGTVIGGHGDMTPNGTVIVEAGSNYDVIFTPDENYALDTVMVNGIMRYPSLAAEYVVDNVYSITNISENYNITVKYKDVRPYYNIHVEISTAGGTVTPKDTTVVIGSDVVLTVTPNAGYRISQLEIDGNVIANYASNEITFVNVTSDHNVTISFFPNSIEDQMFANLSIYPNPNNGNFTVSCDEFEGTVTCQLYNVSGSVVEEKTSNSSSIEFDNNLSAGTYFLRIVSGDKVATRKIVVE